VLACSAGHAFDVARSGYVNLLQPQDRRSLRAGDPLAALASRRRLLAAGVGAAILDDVATRAAGLPLGAAGVVVELGAGSGDLLGAISARRPIAGIGIELSATAAAQASKRFPTLTWIVANADRRLPLPDDGVDLVISFHGRRNADESRRVLRRGGFVLIAAPASDDLGELRARVGREPAAADRAAGIVRDHAAFALLDRTIVRERHDLDRAALLDLLAGTYRGARRSAAAAVASLDALTVTLASEVLLFQRM
jgi:23S rRNA (guanine745-N1)-methyltransferase